MGNCGRFIGNLNFKIFSNFITDISFYKFCEISLIWKMQEKICLKRTGNTGHFMESERNLYEYSNSFRHHTSGICTTGSEYLRYGLSHHWIKSAIPHRTLKNIQLTTSHRGRRWNAVRVYLEILVCSHCFTVTGDSNIRTGHFIQNL